MNIHLKILLVFIRLVNICFSPLGYRLLHSSNAIAFGMYKFGCKIWLLVYFVLYVFVLECFVNKYVFDSARNFEKGNKIIEELKQEIKRRKEQNN